MVVADPQTFERMKEDARRDDWHLRFVGSDIRQLLGEIERQRGWAKDAAELLEHVITADQVVDRNNTMQDTRRDGPLASQARALIKRRADENG